MIAMTNLVLHKETLKQHLENLNNQLNIQLK